MRSGQSSVSTWLIASRMESDHRSFAGTVASSPPPGDPALRAADSRPEPRRAVRHPCGPCSVATSWLAVRGPRRRFPVAGGPQTRRPAAAHRRGGLHGPTPAGLPRPAGRAGAPTLPHLRGAVADRTVRRRRTDPRRGPLAKNCRATRRGQVSTRASRTTKAGDLVRRRRERP